MEQLTTYYSGDIVIDESNFEEYFHDIRRSKPQHGEVIACYTAKAYLVRGNEKKNIIDLLQKTDKMLPAIQVMRKLFHTSEFDAYEVLRQMAEDLHEGITVDECLDKEYGYTAEIYYYTKPEYIPKNDPHWTTISILNLDEIFDRKDTNIRSRVLSEEELSDAKIAEAAKLRRAKTDGDATEE